MNLSPHFTLEELTATSHRGIDNSPSAAVIATLKDTAQHMERVRAILGEPIHVNSGYRCQALNHAVGGSIKSAHLTGHAVDFICPGFGTPPDVCRKLATTYGGIPFDQIIEEGTWVHISFDPQMRGQLLTKAPNGGYTRGLAA